MTQSNCSDGDVRLAGGTTQYEGRVEVCISETWSSVCAYSGWSSNAAKVVCNQIGALSLGLPMEIIFIIIYYNAFDFIGYKRGSVSSLGFSQGSGPVLLGYLSCAGSEANLVSCSQNYYQTNTVSYCQTHYYDAAIECESESYSAYHHGMIFI